jgi:hypothetical protein
VTLDAKGVPTAVKGLREAVKEGMKSSQYAAIVPLDQMYSDAECVKLVKSLLEPLPAGAREVGTPWTGETQLEVSSQPLDFAAEWTLGAANENDATVTSKFTWKPPAAATAGGATTDGGGTGTTTWSRKDGFVRSMKRHLEANRATKEMKATSHTDVTIERLPAK